MNIKLIARYIGIALLFNALFMFISLGVSALNGFDSSFSPLLLSGLITAMVGCFPLILSEVRMTSIFGRDLPSQFSPGCSAVFRNVALCHVGW